MPTVVPFGAPGRERNAPTAPLAARVGELELRDRGRDARDPAQRAIWKSVQRPHVARCPAPRHDYIIGSQPVDAPAP